MVAAQQAWRCTTVPWLEPDKPIVHVSINGQELTFLVDTGAEYDGWIKPEVAARLGLPVVGEVPAEVENDPTAGLPFYGADTVQLGNIVFSGRKFGEMQQFGPTPQSFDGIIGNGLFAGMQAAFDYQHGVLQATDLHLVKGEIAPFTFGIPNITLAIGGKTVVVYLDTGNLASTLSLTESDAATLALAGPPTKKGRAVTAGGSFDIMEAALANPVRYGDTVLPVVHVTWPGAFEGGQIGSKGLAGQTVRIDWRSRKVAIAPEAAAPACP